MNAKNFLANILADVEVKLADEFDRNFERKAFFTDAWPGTTRQVSRGSVLVRSGALRQSIQSRVEGSSITFSSSLPYASIHNEGGTIKVTTAMKKYFWAMYYQASGAITTTSTGKASKSKKNTLLTAEAAYWKSLALIKVGSKLTIKKRQFMGSHPTVDAAVEAIVNRHVNALAQSLAKTLQNKAFK